jgi:hypothetical protein
VFWKLCVLVLVLGLLSCVFSPGAAAQTSDPCLVTTVWFWPNQPPPGWFIVDSPGQGPWFYYIGAWKCPVDPPCPCSDTAGKPISLATGNTYFKQTDIRIPGLSGGLNLVRTWNSTWPASQSALQVGLFGPNWRSTYEEQVFVGSDNHSFAKTPQGHKSRPGNNVTGLSTCCSFQTHF